MECTRSWNIPCNEFFLPESLFNIVWIKIIKSSLLCVYTTKDIHFWVDHHCWMSIPTKRFFTLLLFDVIPDICLKWILVYVIHCEMAVPTSKSVKRVVVNYWCMSKSIWGKITLTNNFSPKVLFHVIRVKICIS